MIPRHDARRREPQQHPLGRLLQDTGARVRRQLGARVSGHQRHAELADALDILTRFREEHRERSAEIDGLIRRTTLIANERAHLVLAGTDLLREVRYMARQVQRMSGDARERA